MTLSNYPPDYNFKSDDKQILSAECGQCGRCEACGAAKDNGHQACSDHIGAIIDSVYEDAVERTINEK